MLRINGKDFERKEENVYLKHNTIYNFIPLFSYLLSSFSFFAKTHEQSIRKLMNKVLVMMTRDRIMMKETNILLFIDDHSRHNYDERNKLSP